MKGLLIIILLLLILGLYFIPALTKSVIRATGHATVEVGKTVVNVIKDDEDVKDAYEKVKENISDKIKGEIIK